MRRMGVQSCSGHAFDGFVATGFQSLQDLLGPADSGLRLLILRTSGPCKGSAFKACRIAGSFLRCGARKRQVDSKPQQTSTARTLRPVARRQSASNRHVQQSGKCSGGLTDDQLNGLSLRPKVAKTLGNFRGAPPAQQPCPDTALPGRDAYTQGSGGSSPNRTHDVNMASLPRLGPTKAACSQADNYKSGMDPVNGTTRSEQWLDLDGLSLSKVSEWKSFACWSCLVPKKSGESNNSSHVHSLESPFCVSCMCPICP